MADEVKYPIETREHWRDDGPWKCVRNTPTHKRGQRFDEPQCSYCEPVKTTP
jgi:hypothetical protein